MSQRLKNHIVKIWRLRVLVIIFPCVSGLGLAKIKSRLKWSMDKHVSQRLKTFRKCITMTCITMTCITMRAMNAASAVPTVRAALAVCVRHAVLAVVSGIALGVYLG